MKPDHPSLICHVYDLFLWLLLGICAEKEGSNPPEKEEDKKAAELLALKPRERSHQGIIGNFSFGNFYLYLRQRI